MTEYNYPENCRTVKQKKLFRQLMRKKNNNDTDNELDQLPDVQKSISTYRVDDHDKFKEYTGVIRKVLSIKTYTLSDIHLMWKEMEAKGLRTSYNVESNGSHMFPNYPDDPTNPEFMLVPENEIQVCNQCESAYIGTNDLICPYCGGTSINEK